MSDKFDHVPKNDDNLRNSIELKYAEKVEEHYKRCSGNFSQKMQSFPRFVSRQQQAIYLFKWELFKEILNVHGSIAEFGVFMGSGVFSFASFSSILEPFNYQRKIIGFDTYEGFGDIAPSDVVTKDHSALLQKGGFYVSDSMYEELKECAEIFDLNRPIGHVQKLEFVKGNIFNTLPAYLEKNPHLLLSLLYLDMDIYEPTKFALEKLYERVVPGGIIAFDELNNPGWPGETKAFLEFFLGKSGKLKKCSFEPLRCYFVKGEN